MGLFGKITTGISQVGETIVQTAGGLSEGAKQAFSDRFPTPKTIGGPITGLGQAATTTGLEVFGKFYEGGKQVSGEVQKITGKAAETITGAPGAIVSGVTAPVGQLTKDVLPLAAVAAAVLLLR